MKIAYIYTALVTVGGADRVVTEKANDLADKRGHEVYIIDYRPQYLIEP